MMETNTGIKVRQAEGSEGIMMFFCPGCGFYHAVFTKDEGYPHERWNFNGDVRRPTFRPSVHVSRPGLVCHSFITDGKIEFLSDCTHEMRNRIVDLPDINALHGEEDNHQPA